VPRPLVLLAALLALSPAAASPDAQQNQAPAAEAPVGLVVTAGLGGGGTPGRGSDSSHGLFELELGAGFELAAGLRPEAAFVLGLAPSGHVGLRAGLRYSFPDLPLFVRGAFDWSSLLRAGAWRWLLLGAGTELQLTDVLGGFAEADVGLPPGRDIGFGFLVRAGVSFRF
jgi:hypothetical protein